MLKSGSILLLILIVLPVACEKEQKTEYSEIELEILDLVNEHRISLGKEPLEMNRYMFEEALRHTWYMISINDMNHDNFNERIERIHENVGTGAAAENVAFEYSSALAVVKGWLTSEGHKRNIEGDYNLTGIAARKDKAGRYYYTQIFLNYTP